MYENKRLIPKKKKFIDKNVILERDIFLKTTSLKL